MNTLFIAFMLTMGCSFVSAQSMRDIWINMPDKLLPYLNKSLRTELADYVAIKANPSIQNLLGDTTSIEKLTDDYLKVNLNEGTTLQVKKLDNNTIAVVKSWNNASSDSDLKLYSIDWSTRKENNADVALEIEKPDTMLASTYSDLKWLISPYFIILTLSEKENSMKVDYAFPLLGRKDDERVRPIVKTKFLRWVDNKFQ